MVNVSVLLSVHIKDSVAFLRDCLDSILSQIMLPNEVVIVKDGYLSPCANDLIASYCNLINIKIIQLKKSKGLGNALRIGLQFCKNEFVARIDSDDVCYPNRLKLQSDILKNNKDLHILGSFADEIDHNGEILSTRTVPVEHSDIIKYIWANPIIHPSVMFRKDSIMSINSYSKMKYRQDYDLWFRAAANNLKFKNIPKALIQYRITRQKYKKRNICIAFKMFLIGIKGCYLNKTNLNTYILVTSPVLKSLIPECFENKIEKFYKNMIQEGNSNKTINLIITGSSGLVGQHILPLLRDHYNAIYSVDRVSSEMTNIVSCISDPKFIREITFDFEYHVLHLAAARFDHGIDAKKYYNENVSNTILFLQNLKNINVTFFLIYSSVAIIPGENIPFNTSLNCDDAYRSTKFIQLKKVQDYCEFNKIPLCNILPSAIHTTIARNDTNIGKLEIVCKYLPFIPKINVNKSITSLSDLSRFTVHLLLNEKKGDYMVIDDPTIDVTAIIQNYAKRSIPVIYIPFLYNILMVVSYVFTFLFFSKFITPNRISKLFTDTSYESKKSLFNYSYYLKYLYK